MKTKLKARRMWANGENRGGMLYLYPRKKEATHQAATVDPYVAVPVAVIPLDDVDELASKAYNAYCDEMERFDAEDTHRDIQAAIIGALTAIGVLPKQRKGRK